MSTSFCDGDIRPKEFDIEKQEALQQDIKRLSAKKAEFIEVSCPACNSENYNFIFEKYSFTFVQCQECETVYMNPRATPEILNEFYTNSVLYEYWDKYIFPASKEVRREKIFKPRLKRILEICEKYHIPTHCLIEVGAGYGIFCEEIKRSGYFERVIAIEPNAALADRCRAVSVEVIEQGVEQIDSTTFSADVVVAFEVIEHLFSPREFLQSCKDLVRSSGLLVVSCPNYKGFDIEPLAEKSDNIDAEHINMFNPTSLALLITQCGFELQECSTPGELDAEIVRNKILQGEYSVEGQSFLQTVLIDRWSELGHPFQEFLKQYGLSSHLWVVAKNP